MCLSLVSWGLEGVSWGWEVVGRREEVGGWEGGLPQGGCSRMVGGKALSQHPLCLQLTAPTQLR